MYHTFNFFLYNNIDTAFPMTLTRLMTRPVPHYMYVGLLMKTEQPYTPINAILGTTDYQSKASGSCSTQPYYQPVMYQLSRCSHLSHAYGSVSDLILGLVCHILSCNGVYVTQCWGGAGEQGWVSLYYSISVLEQTAWHNSVGTPKKQEDRVSTCTSGPSRGRMLSAPSQMLHLFPLIVMFLPSNSAQPTLQILIFIILCPNAPSLLKSAMTMR